MKNWKKIIVLFVLVTGYSISWAQRSNTSPIIDRALFVGDPEIRNAQISPNGKQVSFLKAYEGMMNIWVKDIDKPANSAKPVTSDAIRSISNYFWSDDSKYLLYLQDKGGNENFNLFAVSVNDINANNKVPESKNLTNFEGVRVNIYGNLKSNPDELFIGLNKRDKAWHDLYKLKISTGELSLIKENSADSRISNYYFDWNDQLRLVQRSNKDGSTVLLRVDKDKLESIYETNPFEDFRFISFDKDNKNIYLITNKGSNRDLQQLVLFDPNTMKEELLFEDPSKKVDLKNTNVSEKNKNLLFVELESDKPKRYWMDKNYNADEEILKKQFPNTATSLITSSKDEQKWMIYAYSDINPGSFYVYDRNTKKATFQFDVQPKLQKNLLATSTPIRYKSSDGLEINAYLTLPKNSSGKNLPLVVFPHGGPWARDYWRYDRIAQFLANRGYAVLKPNFRGSTGYGKKFLDAGNKEWGGKMQDDITWGVKHLISQGIADSERVGIMGYSYGGYATLAGVTFTPDLYAVAIDHVGPSNLITLLNTIPPYWESFINKFYLRMGDPRTPEGKAQLERQSPLNFVDKIKTPLMIVQGANDPRVKKSESDQIVVALRNRNYPVEYILAKDEGHGFLKAENNIATYAMVEKFLAKYLGGRYQEEVSPEIKQKLKEMTVDVAKVELSPVAEKK